MYMLMRLVLVGFCFAIFVFLLETHMCWVEGQGQAQGQGQGQGHFINFIIC